MNTNFLQSKDWGKFQKSLGREVRFEPVAIQHTLPRGFYYWYIPQVSGTSWITPFEKITRNDSKCLFIRFETTSHDPLPKRARKVTNIQPARTLVLNLTKTEGDLLAGMHQKTRYNIRLAEKHGVVAREITDATEIDQGIKLLADTEARQGFRGHGKNYYETLLDFFRKTEEVQAKLFGTWNENELLSVGLFIDYADTRTYLFGGSIEKNKNLMAPYLLHWKAIVDAKQTGIHNYDFWGIETSSGKTPGFVKFKLGFGGEVMEYMGAYDIVLRPGWYNVYTTLRKINKLVNRK